MWMWMLMSRWWVTVAKTLVRHPGSFGIGRRPDRSVSLGARHDLPPREFRNPELRSADRTWIEGLQSGALVEDSPVPGRPRVRPWEASEAARKEQERLRLALLVTLGSMGLFGGALGPLAASLPYQWPIAAATVPSAMLGTAVAPPGDPSYAREWFGD